MKSRSVFLAALFGFAVTAPAQKVVIKGSNTFGEELGPRLIQEYAKVRPAAAIELESKGSATGFAALLAGECDIASSSRPANEDEIRLARSRGIRLRPNTIGYYGTAVIVNNVSPVKRLTDAQVRDIFTGAVTNWKSLGGVDGAIKLFIRDPISGTYLGFQELAMERKPYASNAVPLKSYAEIAEAVKADPCAVGYVGMNHAELGGVRALAVNGVSPTATSVNEQAYPYARQIRLYTVQDKASGAALDFIQFVQSKDGQDTLKGLGYVRRFESGGGLKLPEGL